MNVACPTCSAQFRLPDSALASGPRKVRCGKCGHVWAASRESAAAPPRARPRAAAAASPGMAPPPPPPPPPPRATRSADAPAPAPAPKAPARAERRGGGLWIWWLLLLVLIAALVAGGWFGRGWLVEQWPPAIRFYDWVGIDLPRIEISEVSEQAVGEGASQRRTIGGMLQNHADAPLPVPPLHYLLYDGEGTLVHDWEEPPPVATLGPGESVAFVSSVEITSDAASWDVVLKREAEEDMASPDGGEDDAPEQSAPADEADGDAH